MPWAFAVVVMVLMMSRVESSAGSLRWPGNASLVGRGLTRAELVEIAAGTRDSTRLRRDLLAISRLDRDDPDPSAMICITPLRSGEGRESTSSNGAGWPIGWWQVYETRTVLINDISGFPSAAARRAGWSARWPWIRCFTPASSPGGWNRLLVVDVTAIVASAWVVAAVALTGVWIARRVLRRWRGESSRRSSWRIGCGIAVAALLAVILVPPIENAPHGRPVPTLPYALGPPIGLTLSDVTRLPDAASSDRTIAEAIERAWKRDPHGDDVLAAGFSDQAASDYESVGLGRWFTPLSWMVVEKGPPMGEAAAGRGLVVRTRARSIEVVTNHGAWPGRSVWLRLNPGNIAVLVTLAVGTFWLARLAFALAVRARRRRRLRDGRCLTCGYPLVAV
ncbi:MAG: hypothetical protein ACKVW3_04560 [Phycisphaerales bacterium]